MKELYGPGLQHVQDDLGVFGIVLVPAIVQGRSYSSQSDGRDKLQVETGLAEMMRQSMLIIAGRLEPDPHWQLVAGEGRGQALEVFRRVQDRQAAAAPLAWDADQHLVAVLGNVDGDQQGRRDRMGGGS